MRLQGDDWSRKIPVESKVLLMQLLNIESKVAKGDCSVSVQDDRPQQQREQREQNRNVSLRELFENKPSAMCGRRTEVRKNFELKNG